MRLAPADHRAYTYRVTTGPVNPAIDKSDLVLALKLPAAAAAADDAYLDLVIAAATGYAERFTRRDFITRTYKTFRDGFPTVASGEGYYIAAGIEIRRSRLLSVVSIKYWIDDVLTTLASSVYYATDENDYSEIHLAAGQSWPSTDNRLQAVEIEFTAGFGPDTVNVPVDLQLSILQLAQAMYVNRGDCSDDACAKAMPSSVRSVLQQYRIENL